jgi:hypothetical protein
LVGGWYRFVRKEKIPQPDEWFGADFVLREMHKHDESEEL